MATVLAPPQRQGIILNTNWEGYVTIGEVFRDQPVRMNYDRGRLEIMTVSHEHEWIKKLLSRMLEMLVVVLKIRMHSGGSTTFRREELDRGMEPDECYWIQHEEQMRGKHTFDVESDPPPDLALEVEISRSVLNRLGIYAALGIPEVWRYDGETIRVLLLSQDGTYQPASASEALPMVPVAELARFLAQRETTDETALLSAFLDWVQEQQATDWGKKKPRGRKKK